MNKYVFDLRSKRQQFADTKLAKINPVYNDYRLNKFAVKDKNMINGDI